MPSKKVLTYRPDAGGKAIPDVVKADVTRRIQQVAEQHYKGKYTRLDVFFKGHFCYIDAYQEPIIEPTWPPAAGWPESREEYIERLRAIPTHLCRLRYFGNDKWGFAFYTYSNERYELATYPRGEFLGTPEEAFLASAIYLNG